MIIYFVEAERAEEQFFSEALPGHELHFVTRIEDVSAHAEIVSMFIYSPVDAAFLEAHPHLRLIATRSQAVDHIDLPGCRERGVLVARVPSYGETTVAEHTFALILALSRRLREVMLKPKEGRFSYEATRGFDLQGKTIGIIGMGRIGQRVAGLAHAFAMRVLAYDLQAQENIARSLGFEYASIEKLFAESDIISLHATLSPETYHIVNGDTLNQCKRGVIIVNTARGSLIENNALRDALNSGHVGGAGLDVLQDERVLRDSASHIIAGDIVKNLRSDALAHEARDADRIQELQELMLSDDILSRANVVFTPHAAFNSVEAVARIREVTVENITSFIAGEGVNVVE